MWSLFGYAVLQGAFGLVVDRVDPAIRDAEYARKLASLEELRPAAGQRPLMLVLGTSRTTYGLRPDQVWPTAADKSPRVFNFGALGAAPVHELVLLRRILERGILPDYLVVEVHPGVLPDVPCFAHAMWPSTQRCDARDLRLISRFAAYPARLWFDWFRLRLGTCHAYRGEFVSRLAPLWVPGPAAVDPWGRDATDDLGWVRGPELPGGDAERQRRAAYTVAAYESAFQDYRVSEISDRALREILDTCRREGIVAALLLMPESSEMRQRCHDEVRPRVDAYLSALGRAYEVEVFDGSGWCPDQQFSDAQHLLASGASTFSQRFGSELQPWVESSSRQPAGMARQQSRLTR
jgi:hypothetical protein